MNRPRQRLLIPFLLLICASASIAQEKLNNGCPEFELFTSLNVAIVGDRITFNVVATGGTLKPSELKFDWRVFPSGKITISKDTTTAALDTSTIRAPQAIVSVDFSDFRKCSWRSSSGEINIRSKGPYNRIDDFWWWFQLNSERFRAYKMPDYGTWLNSLQERLKYIDKSLTFDIDHERPDPLKRTLIIRAKPGSAAVLKSVMARSPKLGGWEFITAK